MMMAQIFKFVHSPKTQKSKYLQNKQKIFLQIKKFIHQTLWFVMTKNSFLAKVTFKGCAHYLLASLFSKSKREHF